MCWDVRELLFLKLRSSRTSSSKRRPHCSCSIVPGCTIPTPGKTAIDASTTTSIDAYTTTSVLSIPPDEENT
jgi:hypothetical protein